MSIGLGIEFYDNSCLAPTVHPKDPLNHYPIMMKIGTGCDTAYFGTDDTYSHFVDKQNEWDYYINSYKNDDAGWPLA